MFTALFRRQIQWGVSLLVSGLMATAAAGCSSPQAASLPLVMDTDPPTVAPTATRTPTRMPTPRPSPTATATSTPLPPTPTLVPSPTAIVTPNPEMPPQPDGVKRSATVPILMYHYISAAPSAQDRIRYGLSAPPEMFEAQLKLLHDNGFTTVTLRDVYEYLVIGRPLPGKPIVLTFDDGYVDNYANAFPLLQKYGMVGTFFVLTGPADDGNPAYLSWDMIQAMSGAGMDMQLHARNHYDMRNRSAEWLFFQIVGGRQSIEGHTGKPVIFMAYPSGKYDANVLRFLERYNFWAAVTTVSGKTHTLNDRLLWTRLRISGQLRLADFAKMLDLKFNPPEARQTLPLTPTPTKIPASSRTTGLPATHLTAVVTMVATVSVPLPTPTKMSFTSPLPTPPVSPLSTPAQ